MPETTLNVKILGTAQGFINAARSAANALKPLDTSLRKVNQSFNSIGQKANIFTRHASGAQKLGSSYKGLIGQVTSMNRGFNILASSIRQVGQGLQNFGTTLSVFVSLPVGAFLRSSVKDALAFDNAMIEVRKTTGLVGDDLARLSSMVRDISLESPTDPAVLAEIAAAWGRMGISVPENIGKLVKATDQLQIATTLTADQAVSDLGRIGNIFYDTTQEFVDNYENLGSAINELGQANAVTENEIVAAALRMAPAAKAMGIEVETLLALATTAAATNASAERAGTQTAAAISKSITSLKKVSELTGQSTDEIVRLIRTDPEKYFLDLAYSLNQVDDPLQKIIGSTQIFGLTGGKAMQALSAAFPTLAKNLAISNKAYADGVSLQMEYERALDSVSTQLGILRNNVRYLATDVANTLLPYITKFSALAIPAVQLLTGAFGQLSERTKLLIVGFGLLLTVVGPLLVALGSLLFSIGIIATGFTAFITFITTAIGSVFGLVGGILSLLSPLKLLAVAFAGAAIASFVFAEQLGGVAALVQKYIRAAYAWGYNLITSFADGILSAATAVYNAVASVINSFIGLIQAFSPPKEGPLTDIEQWGMNVMGAFADGIASASGMVQNAVGGIADDLRNILSGFDNSTFDTFIDMWGNLESTINAVASSVGLTGNELTNFLKNSATQLADLLSRLRSGEIGSAVGQLGGLGGFLGEFAPDIEKLIDLQFRYSQLEEEISKVEDAINSLNSAYEEQIGLVNESSDISANEGAALIRQAMLKKTIEERNLKTKKAELEETAKSIERQEELIRLLTGFLLEPGAGGAGGGGAADSPLKKLKDDAGDLLDELGKFDLLDATEAIEGLGEGALSELSDKFDSAGEKAESFIDKISRARDVVAGFIFALRGGEAGPEQLAELGENFTLGFEKGAEIRETVLDFLAKIQGYYARWLIFVGFLAGAFTLLKEGVKDALGIVEDALDTDAVTTATTEYNKLQQIIYNLGKGIGNIAKKLNEMGQAFLDNIDPDGTLTQKLQDLRAPITSIFLFLAGIAMLVFDNLDELAGYIGTLAGWTIDAFAGIVGLAGVLAELVLTAAGHGDVNRLATSLNLVYDGAGKWAGDITNIVNNIGQYAQALANLFSVEIGEGWKDGSIQLAGINLLSWEVSPEKAENFKNAAQTVIDAFNIINLLDGPSTLTQMTLIGDAAGILYKILSDGSQVTEEDRAGATDSADTISNMVSTIASLLADIAFTRMEKIQDIVAIMNGIYETLKAMLSGDIGFGTAVSRIVQGYKDLVGGLIEAFTPVGKLAELAGQIDDAFKKAGDALKNLTFGGDEVEAQTISPDVEVAPNITFVEPEENSNGFVNAVKGFFTRDKTDEATAELATNLGASVNTSLTNIPATTYDPLASGITTWAAGDGAAMIDENALGFAGSLGTGIQTALEENYLFWDGLITSFNSWWEETGLTWASDTAGVLIFKTINDKIYELFDTMMPTYQRIIFAYRKWYNTAKTVLVNIGKQIGETILDGVREMFDDADSYMNNMVVAMNAWIEANKTSLEDVGKAIGEIIGDAIVDEIEDKLDDLTNSYSPPDSGSPQYNRTVTPASSVVDPFRDFPNQLNAASVAAPAYTFNINIEGNVDSDSRMTDIMDELYRRISRDMRFA